jgi:Xaa-Pro aminopeptidase
MAEKHVDAFYISNHENVRYVSGYTGDDSSLLVTAAKAYFLTDPRYTEQAALECPGWEVVNWRKPGCTMGDALGAIVQENGLKALAFEAPEVTYEAYADLREKAGTELVPVSGIIEALRRLKTEEEIFCLRAACEIAARAFEKILPDIRVGITEKELASRLSHYMVMEGADTQPYGNILISGARTSLLHGIPSAKAVEYGDLVLMDYGCQYHGYLSDMTRTVVVGKASKKQHEVYNLVAQMQAGAIEKMQPGASGVEVYEASVKPIQETPYLPYHYTGIGHGVGLFVHEVPFMGPRGTDKLVPGTVLTIEPGLYIPGWGGVRIEDQLLITETGNEVLTNARKELIEL